MNTEAAQFHLAKNGEELGVFTEKQIKKAYSDGGIDGECFLWKAGMENWVSIFEVFPQWRPSEAQIQFLKDCRFEISPSLTKLEASRLLEKRPPSNYELRVLKKMGLRGGAEMLGQEASIKIDEFSNAKPEKFDKIRDQIRAEDGRRCYEEMIQNMPVALKRELLGIEEEANEEGKKISEKQEEKKKAEKELIELRKKKTDDQEEQEELASEIEELEESIKDLGNEIIELKETLPEAKKERAETKRDAEKGRVIFWETTFVAESPKLSDDDEFWLASLESNIGLGHPSPASDFPLRVAFATPSSRRLFSDYGHQFTRPQKNQISQILKALDDTDPIWEEKDVSLFFQTLASWFPELKK